jgi:hypothetical protein
MMDAKNIDEFDELASLFGGGNEEIEKMERVVLSQNLEGFASCFPEWDLHPPVLR